MTDKYIFGYVKLSNNKAKKSFRKDDSLKYIMVTFNKRKYFWGIACRKSFFFLFKKPEFCIYIVSKWTKYFLAVLMSFLTNRNPIWGTLLTFQKFYWYSWVFLIKILHLRMTIFWVIFFDKNVEELVETYKFCHHLFKHSLFWFGELAFSAFLGRGEFLMDHYN